MEKTTMLKTCTDMRHLAATDAANSRPAPILASVLATVAIIATGCGGVQFKRATGSGKYRALPVGTDVRVAQEDAELGQPTEVIGDLALTTQGDPPAHRKALDAMKRHAGRYGCDALVGFTNAKRETPVKRKVKSLGKGGVPVYTEVTEMRVEYDWTAQCVRTADAPKQTKRAATTAVASSSSGTRPAHAKPAHAKPAHVEPAHVEPARAEPAHGEPAHAEPAHAEPAYVAPTRAEPAAPTPAPIETAPPANGSDPQVASEVARAFIRLSMMAAQADADGLCKLLEKDRIYFDIRASSPPFELRKDLAPAEACASMHGGELAGYLRDFGPAEVHAEVATLIPTLFRIHGGAYVRLDEAREADYQRQVVASREGKKPLACTMYTVLPAGDLFKVSLSCNGVQSFRVLMRRAGPDDFRLMALTHVR